MKRTIRELEAAVGGLSEPSKMPGFSYGIPADECIIGSILRTRPGSVCSKCYARKGMYVFPVVRDAQNRRIGILRSNLEQWRKDMTELLSRKYRNREKVFRWHDSGDLQSWEHLSAIVQIAKDLPDFRFWLPTKEYGIVRKWIQVHGRFPRNLAVRVSAPMIGQRPAPIRGTVSSTVGTGKGHICPAPSQGGHCGDCRACWKKTVKTVDYHPH